jgi:hypothetical protein
MKKFFYWVFAGLVLSLALRAHAADEPLFDRIGPVAKNSGFHMPGYFVWCGSAIKVGDTYHLFASRWPESTKFPEGYREHSEIVRATASKPEGPYVFQEVVIGRRESGKWDSGMAHNPAIYKVGDTFVLYYIGSPLGSHRRQVGYASAPAITGPWTRLDAPLDLGIKSDANNPAACFERDGSVKLLWRNGYQRLYISAASSYRGPYTLTNDNAFPSAKLEDFSFFKAGGKYHIISEDNAGKVTGHSRWGADICSPDGISNWVAAPTPSVYDHTIRWTDGTKLDASRRERPWLLIENGQATALFTAIWDGTNTWNQAVPIIPTLAVDQ